MISNKLSVEQLLTELAGSRYKNQISKLLNEVGTMSELLSLNEDELINIGCTTLLSSKIVSFKRLHQYVSKEAALSRYRINSPKSIADIYQEEMRYYDKEHMKVIFLDTKNGIIDDIDISVGTVNASLIDSREVYIAALQKKAVHIILMHNHPSGDPTPSQDDILVTKRCVDAGKIIGIECLDHIIIGNGNFISMKEQGLARL